MGRCSHLKCSLLIDHMVIIINTTTDVSEKYIGVLEWDDVHT